MKKILIVIAVLIVLVLGLLAYLGYVPGLSSVFGADKPRDLGIKYTQADFDSAFAKSQVVYEALPAGTPDELSLQRRGSRPVNISFTAAEATSLMNDRPFKYWPYKQVQLKFNADGSAEISGVLVKERVSGYCAAIGIPKAVAEAVVKFLPNNPVFYVKGKGELVDNMVTGFEPQALEVGRMPLPLGMILAFNGFDNQAVYAADANITELLSKATNKRQIIIDYINRRLASITGFYAKNAKFEENKLIFEGSLPEVEATAR